MINAITKDLKGKTQAQMVFDFLMRYGKLTRITAVHELGVMELSSRIGEIEAGTLDSGPWLIPRTSVPFKARNGRKSRFMEYHTPVKPPSEIGSKAETVTKKYVGVPESEQWSQVGNVVVMAGGALDAEQYTLDPRFDLVNHSPTGFAWGYGGSGPAQLALAILADATGNDGVSLLHYQQFKCEKIAPLGEGRWEISASDVLDWLSTK